MSDDDFQDEKHIMGSPDIDEIIYHRYPFNYTVLIIGTDKATKKQWIGTGCLFLENIILTCLHNLVGLDKNPDKPVSYDSLQIHVSRHGQASPDLEYKVVDIKYDKRYFQLISRGESMKAKAYDYAILVIAPKSKNPTKIYQQELPLSIPNCSSKNPYLFELYGYDYQSNMRLYEGKEFRLFGAQSYHQEMTNDFIYYKISTQSGKSGAPIITYCRQGVFKIIGVHLGYHKNKDMNMALRINESVIQNISKWIKELEIPNQQVFNSIKSHIILFQKKKEKKQQKGNSFVDLFHHFLKVFQFGQEAANSKNNNDILESAQVNFKQQFYVLLKPQKMKNKNEKVKSAFVEDFIFDKERQYKKRFSIQQSSSKSDQIKTYQKITQKMDPFVQKQQKIDKITTLTELNHYLKQNSKEDNSIIVQNIPFTINLLEYIEKTLINLTLVLCELKEIPEDMFSSFSTLTYINCSENHIRDATPFFTPYVIEVELDYNQIEEIAASIQRAQNIQSLRLDNNDIRLIHGNIFKIIPPLKKLFIRNNKHLMNEQVLHVVNNLKDRIEVDDY